jgi:hypothetical protein
VDNGFVGSLCVCFRRVATSLLRGTIEFTPLVFSMS